jgi:hypothetical protein
MVCFLSLPCEYLTTAEATLPTNWLSYFAWLSVFMTEVLSAVRCVGLVAFVGVVAGTCLDTVAALAVFAF